MYTKTRIGILCLVFLWIGSNWLHAQSSKQPLVIACKNFTENEILAEIMAQLIEARHPDIPVERRYNLGATLVVFDAMKNGNVDIYPDYTGTGWAILLKIDQRIRDSLKAYAVVAQRMQTELDIHWLMPFGFENSFALAMAEDRANELDIEKISDLIPHQKDLSIAVSLQFDERDDGYKGLTNAYNLKIGTKRVMEHGLAYESIRSGEMDLVDTWTTDGKLSRLKMRILEDDLGFFPPYDACPVVRGEILKKYPELHKTLNQLGFQMDNETMQEMNRRVEEGETVKSVARSFLISLRLIQGKTQKQTRSSNFFLLMKQRVGETFRLAGEHLYLTGIAVLLAILIAVPLGIALTRWEPLASITLGATGVIQTIPSLALLVFMIPMLGLGMKAAIAALFLYALLPILRNTYTGINEVDEHLLEAARGIGMKNGQILWKVELPLAVRTIMAGIRTATVISIGVATLAAFIGAGGLGEPIVKGLQLNETNLILAGAVPAAMLALLVDFLLGRIENLVRPRGMRED